MNLNETITECIVFTSNLISELKNFAI
jgi:hypothetical protein